MSNLAKKKFEYNNITFDSEQQIDFYKWLQQGVQAGIVQEFEYQPNSFLLFQSARKDGKHLLRQHVYTPDYKIKFKRQLFDKISSLQNIFKYTPEYAFQYVDVKGGYNIWNNHSQFSINRKWVFDKYGIFVYKLEPDKVFNQSWVPEASRFTPKTKQLRKKYADCKVIEDFLKLHNINQ